MSKWALYLGSVLIEVKYLTEILRAKPTWKLDIPCWILDIKRGFSIAREASFFTVTTTGVEPAHPKGHYPLKVARLPIPPRGQFTRHSLFICRNLEEDSGEGGCLFALKPHKIVRIF